MYQTAVQEGNRDVIDAIAIRLYDRLIRPLATSIVRSSTLVIIPDAALNAIPFAALKDQHTGRYLVEDHTVNVAPSATVLDRASIRLRRAGSLKRASIVVFADPRLDRAETRDLPPLTEAKAEARDIAAIYRDATVLTDERATRSAFLDATPRYQVVHFAGHALANERYPLLSQLLLSRGNSDRSGALS